MSDLFGTTNVFGAYHNYTKHTEKMTNSSSNEELPDAIAFILLVIFIIQICLWIWNLVALILYTSSMETVTAIIAWVLFLLGLPIISLPVIYLSPKKKLIN